MPKNKLRWMRLDNAAKIYPAARSQTWSRSIRKKFPTNTAFLTYTKNLMTRSLKMPLLKIRVASKQAERQLMPCDFLAAILYLLYINIQSGGNWFLPFALPVGVVFALIITAVVTLVKYVKKGYLYIFGGMFIALGVFAILVEFLLNITFPEIHFVLWSIYPLVAFGLLGAMLIFLAICRPARENLERKFFI